MTATGVDTLDNLHKQVNANCIIDTVSYNPKMIHTIDSPFCFEKDQRHCEK